MANEISTPNYDSAWKGMLREFLNPMIKSVLPELYAELDLNEPPMFLDNEIEDLAKELSSMGEDTIREVDLLVDLPLKNKVHDSVRILLHCEVQGRGGKDNLNFRMYRYRSLLELRYKKPVVALAIITEPLSSAQMSGEYREENFGTESVYRFNVLKVFEASEDLQDSDNPFDLAQLAAARAWRANKNEAKRFEYLKEFIRILNKKGLNHLEKYRLVKFLETIFKISKAELKHDYVTFLKEEKKKEDETMLIIEELAVERGLAQGIKLGEIRGELRGKLETARRLLDMGLNFETVSQATGLTEAQLRA